MTSDVQIENMKHTYILVDNVPGNSNQARRISEICKLNGKEVYLDYNLLGSVTNKISLGLLRLKGSSRNDLSNLKPDTIISSGRRAAAIALEIKNRTPNTKIIQIMNPELHFHLFDLILLPRHDIKDHLLKHKNILWIDGAVSNPDIKKIESEAELLRKEYDISHSTPICSLIIGGSTGKKSITKDNIDEIMSLVSQYIEKTNSTLIVTTSRRTPHNIINHLEYYTNNQPYRIILYKYSPNSLFNPYWGMIGASSAIIATSDSISMCSEIASCHKSLFLYGTHSMLKPKHQRFMNSLIERGIAKDLRSGIRHYTPSQFNQTEIIRSAVNTILNK